MKIAVLLRGYHWLARDRFGFPLDARRYLPSLRAQILEPLRQQHQVTVLAVTYPSPVQEKFLDALRPDRAQVLPAGSSSQVETFAEALRMIREEASGPFERVLCTRFDLVYHQTLTAWPMWDRQGIYLPWREYEAYWRAEQKTGDTLHVIDRPWLSAFAAAVESLRGRHDLHGLYPALRRKEAPVHFLAEGFYDSNTLYSNAECANPLYQIGNRPRLPVPNPARPPDGARWRRFLQNRMSYAVTRLAAWQARRREAVT